MHRKPTMEVGTSPVWNKGAFDDGYAARIVHGGTLEDCPSPNVIGHYAAASWKAGWLQAQADWDRAGGRLPADEKEQTDESRDKG